MIAATDSTDADPVRFGVLGAASVAWRRMLPALSGLPGIEIAAVASRDLAKATRFTDRFGGVPVHGYDELLARPDVDAIYLALPNGLHHQWAAAALRAGKHVLGEKPMTTSAADTEDLLRLAERRNLVLRENFAFAHHPLHGVVSDLLDRGRLGALRHLTGSFCYPGRPADDVRNRADLGGGALLDAGVYPLRLAQYLLGDKDRLEVTGAVLRVDRGSGLDVSGSALLVARTGVIVTAEFGFEHSYASRYQLWGAGARLTVDRAFAPPPQHRPVLRIDEQDHTEELVLAAADQHAGSAAAFADAVRATRYGAPGGPRDAAATLRTAELVDEIRAIARRIPVSGGG
ncbi:Gfo/Idh/MocA family protein [Nocardia terpenica]|uniref:Gfo/Idh/MocA family oxidoreductase n=1 Tax=Nocardia terpenica TaxID=455432 RepID=A0A6G9Z620_9NOCA|nr:Gfo/Idh/MocA family oxidoreductase [Nocardia terpenica]QIS20453.1 gfo/Idh/MocA family oxidoreductase [Nocardia terpenica]